MNKEIKLIDCLGMNCPLPLIKTRKAIMDSKSGDLVKVVGDHMQSFDEILMALESLNIECVEKEKKEDSWYIIFQK